MWLQQQLGDAGYEPRSSGPSVPPRAGLQLKDEVQPPMPTSQEAGCQGVDVQGGSSGTGETRALTQPRALGGQGGAGRSQTCRGPEGSLSGRGVSARQPAPRESFLFRKRKQVTVPPKPRPFFFLLLISSSLS